MLEFLRYLFLPHGENNHRSKVLHIDALAVYAIVFGMLALMLPVGVREYPEVLGYATDIRVEELLKDTNQKRAEMDIVALTLNPQLSYAAAQKAKDMFALGYWAHNNPSGKRPWDFITEAGYQYSIAGENLAKNFSTSRAVVDAWIASPTHYENLVKGGYKEVGFAVLNGVLNGEETTLVVQMFGSQLTANRQALVLKPTIVPTPIKEEKAFTLVINPTPTEAVKNNEQSAVVKEVVLTDFAAVTNSPKLDLNIIRREVLLFFLIGFLGILAIDAYIAYKRSIVRLTGHSVAHILFISAIFVCIYFVRRGALL